MGVYVSGTIPEGPNYPSAMTREERTALQRTLIGWNELREEIRQLIREELIIEFQSIFGSWLNKDGGTTSTGKHNKFSSMQT